MTIIGFAVFFTITAEPDNGRDHRAATSDIRIQSARNLPLRVHPIVIERLPLRLNHACRWPARWTPDRDIIRRFKHESSRATTSMITRTVKARIAKQ